MRRWIRTSSCGLIVMVSAMMGGCRGDRGEPAAPKANTERAAGPSAPDPQPASSPLRREKKGIPKAALLAADPSTIETLLEAKLLAGNRAVWVERNEIEKVLKEQSLQAMFSPEAVSGRASLGKLLKADLLVITRRVTGDAGNTLELIVCETAQGLRLCAEKLVVAKDPEATVQSLATMVDHAMAKYAEEITDIWAVPPFMSQDLTDDNDYLKHAYARIMEQTLLAQPAVLVVELAEARAVAKEDEVAGGDGVVRRQPHYVIGQFRDEVRGDRHRVVVELKLTPAAKAVKEPAAVDLAPEDVPQHLRLATVELIKTAAGREVTLGTVEPEIRQLVRRATQFTTTGQFVEAYELYEASLLLNPRDPEGLEGLQKALVPLLQASDRRKPGAPSQGKEGALYSRYRKRAFECLELLYRWHPSPWQIDYRPSLESAKGFGIIDRNVEYSEESLAHRKMATLSFESLLLEIIHQVVMRCPDPARAEWILADLGRYFAELGDRHLPATVQAIESAAGSPHARQYAVAIGLEFRSQHGVDPTPQNYRPTTPKRTWVVHRRRLETIPMHLTHYSKPPFPEVFALVDRLSASRNAAIREAAEDLKEIYAIDDVTAEERHEIELDYARRLALVEEELKEHRLWNQQYGRKHREIQWEEDRQSPVPLPDPEPVTTLCKARDLPPEFRSEGVVFRPVGFRRRNTRGVLAPESITDIIPVGDGLDAVNIEDNISLIREKGRMDVVWPRRKADGGISSLCYDGRYIWGATITTQAQNPCLIVIDPQSKRVWTLTTSDGLPFPKSGRTGLGGGATSTRSLHVAALTTGKVCAVGYFGRSWIGVITFDPDKGIKVDVVYEARALAVDHYLPKFQHEWKDLSLGVAPKRIIPLAQGADPVKGPRFVLVFRDVGWQEWATHPILCDLENRDCRFLESPLVHQTPYYYDPSANFGQYHELAHGLDPQGRLVRYHWPDFSGETLADVHTPGYMLLDGDLFHIAGRRWVTGSLADGTVRLEAKLPWLLSSHEEKNEPGRARKPYLHRLCKSNHFGLLALVGDNYSDTRSYLIYQVILPVVGSAKGPEAEK